MSSLVQTVVFWFRQNVGWSNSRQSWQERLGVLALLAGAVLLWRYAGGLALGQKLVLGVAWLAALAFVLRRGWLKLFGPVLFYDMVRVSRRSTSGTVSGLPFTASSAAAGKPTVTTLASLSGS